MTLGEKIKQARLEAGLSQRALCGTEITRNMLSQIENNSAQPSMSTLRFLAGQLKKPISYFLEEEFTASPNHGIMKGGWLAYEAGNYSDCLRLLDSYQSPDSVYDREQALLRTMAQLNLARECILSGREIYARELIEKVSCPRWMPELENRRLELLSLLEPMPEEALPNLDISLLIRANAALSSGLPSRAIRILEAAQLQTPRWHLLRGKAALALEDYAAAANHLQQAETEFSKQTIPLLEQCFKELGDFKSAYYYACKSR